MKTFFNYSYYKFCKYYENWGESDGHIAGSVLLFFPIASLFLTFTNAIFYFFNFEFNKNIVVMTCIPFAILSLLSINKKKYKELEKKYKREKYSKLKGWLLFLYLIGAFVLFIASLYVFKV